MAENAAAFNQIVQDRRSIRAFLPQAVPRKLMDNIFGAALQAPSNCNTQPWFVHIVTGNLLEQLREALPRRFMAGDVAPDYPYDGKYDGAFKARQYGAAQVLYDALGIQREQREERQQWFMRNFSFFDAPAVAFFALPAAFGLREACDLGMFAQTVMLGLTANGLGSCPQTALGFMANIIRPALELPDDQKLMFGMSFGYPDWQAPVNGAMTERAGLVDLIHYHQ
mgnify:CR=1 FL=1